jgi:diguanylate cyclase (GGDEF)-like protein
MAALHYIDPPNNRLMYRLEGFDPEWIETTAQNRVATYTNLALAAVSLVAAGVRRRGRVKLALLERETLRRESLTDPLTGLRNRRFLMTYLQHEVPSVLRQYRIRGAAAAESGNDLLLLLVDVDHFKSINDRYSHAVGDRVITRIAATLQEQIRDSDIAVRWGGDEFLIMTRSFRRASGADYAERLRAAVEAAGQVPGPEGDPACTVSIGFAAFPFVPSAPEALTWEKTLDLADYALRLTKARRRNSFTGLVARAGVDPVAVTEFLTCSDVSLPAGVAIVTHEEGER